MGYDAIKCFEVKIIGERPEVGVMWDGPCDPRGLHVARRFTAEVAPVGSLELPDIHEPVWVGEKCDSCGAEIDKGTKLTRFGGMPHIFDTPDGTWQHPGAMWMVPHYKEGVCYNGWENCPGAHLHVVLPNGHSWDVDSRANNCDRRDDATHRCWVRSGEIPNVTAGKAGNTCSAGAGSILAGDYHGFLRDGWLTASL